LSKLFSGGEQEEKTTERRESQKKKNWSKKTPDFIREIGNKPF